jgi:hypothetical protein
MPNLRTAGDETSGPYPNLAKLVREIAGGAATRVVARRTKLSHSTAAALLNGEKVSANTLLLFATGYRVPLNPLREAMGLEPLAVDPTARMAGISGGVGDPLLMVGAEIPQELFGDAFHNTIDVCAGIERLTEATDEGEKLFDVTPRTIRICGNCMEPFYKNGDVVMIRPAETVLDGDTVIALIDFRHITCKVIRIKSDGESYLMPTNGEAKISSDRFTVVGVVWYKLEATPRRRAVRRLTGGERPN